jgi:hypothetical protein
MEYNTSDKLAIALACLAGVMAIILFLVEKTPLTVILLLSLMLALAIYPILHFAKHMGARVVVFSLFVIGALVLGWHVMPHSHSISANTQEPQRPAPEDKKDDKKSQDTKKQEPKPKPKTEQPPQDNRVGSVEQGPCSNLQIGGSGNQATTNCGAAVAVIYSYNGSVKKTVSGGRINTNVSQPDARLLKIVEKMSAGYNSEALADATTLMANEPQWATPHVEAAFAYINLGNLDAAKAELKKARDLAPAGYEYEEDYAPHFQHLEEAIKRHEPAPN